MYRVYVPIWLFVRIVQWMFLAFVCPLFQTLNKGDLLFSFCLIGNGISHIIHTCTMYIFEIVCELKSIYDHPKCTAKTKTIQRQTRLELLFDWFEFLGLYCRIVISIHFRSVVWWVKKRQWQWNKAKYVTAPHLIRSYHNNHILRAHTHTLFILILPFLVLNLNKEDFHINYISSSIISTNSNFQKPLRPKACEPFIYRNLLLNVLFS